MVSSGGIGGMELGSVSALYYPALSARLQALLVAQSESDYQFDVIHPASELPATRSRELVDLLFELPYCCIAKSVEAGIAKRHTSTEYLKRLVKAGIQCEEKEGGKNRLFIRV